LSGIIYGDPIFQTVNSEKLLIYLGEYGIKVYIRGTEGEGVNCITLA
jgi:hypothetical protein